MSTKDLIWALVAKRVNDEASIEELQELDKLLKKYPGTDWQIKVIAGWWREEIWEEIAVREALIFEKDERKNQSEGRSAEWGEEPSDSVAL